MNSLLFTLSEAMAPARAVEVVTDSRLRPSTSVEAVTSRKVRSQLRVVEHALRYVCAKS
jgi:hypothetical protein